MKAQSVLVGFALGTLILSGSAFAWDYSGDADIAVGISGHEAGTVKFAYGTNTLSGDVSFKQAQVGKVSPEQVFDFRVGNHKVTTTGGNFEIKSDNCTAKFLGGVWDLSRFIFNPGKDNTNGSAGNDITLDAGCIWTNVVLYESAPIFCKAAANGRFRILNGSRLYGNSRHKNSSSTGGKLIIFDDVDTGGRLATNMYFEVSGGSYLNVDNLYFQDTSKAGSIVDRDLNRNNRILISGQNTFVETASLYIGDGSSGSRVSIAHGAKVYTKNVYGSGTSVLRDCPVTISDGGTLVVDGHFEVGKNTSGGLKFLVVDGGVIQAGEANAGKLDLRFTSPNNEMVVSNATLKCARIGLGHTAGADGNKLVVAGSESILKIDASAAGSSPMTLFGLGSNGRFEISSGAQASYPKLAVKLSDAWGAGSGNELCVRGMDSKFTIASDVIVTNDVDNAIRIADGGMLVCEKNVYFGGTNTQLVVDNGTLSCTMNTQAGGASYSAVQIGGDLAYNGSNIGKIAASSNATLVIRGDRPSVSIPDTAIRFGNNAVLRFELPPTGYQPGVVPMVVSAFREGADATQDRGMRIEIANLSVLQSNITARQDIVLVRAMRSYADRGAVAEANAVLPKGCSLSWKPVEGSDENDLVLHVRPTNVGLMLIFR